MKKTACLLFACIFSMITFAQVASFKNLSFNQAAEDSMSGASYWQTKEFVNASRVVKRTAQEDSHLSISGTYSSDKPGYVFQQHKISVDTYTKLIVSAKIKAEDITEGYGGIYCYTKNGEQWLQYKNLEQAAGVEGTTEWKEVSLQIWLSPNANTLRIGCSLDGKGKLLVDDFQLEIVSSSDCKFDEQYLAFMQECIDTIAIHSLYRKTLDKNQLLNDWKQLSACARNKKEVQDALGMILRSIDNHSFYWTTGQVKRWRNTTGEEANIVLSKGHHIDKHYAYIWMPYFSSGNNENFIYFANHLQKLIDSLDHPELKGWVLDIRDNQGGNCWPMLAGIGPILGDGICGYFKDGENAESLSYENGKSKMNDLVQTEIDIKPYVPHLENPPVAVLMDNQTASSGEIVALAFMKRGQSKSFGSNSGGYTTANNNFDLSDGSMIFIAGSIYADRTKQEYPSGFQPDVEVQDDKETEEDEVVEKAVEWLREQ